MANFIKGLLNSSLQVRLILLCNFLSAGFLVSGGERSAGRAALPDFFLTSIVFLLLTALLTYQGYFRLKKRSMPLQYAGLGQLALFLAVLCLILFFFVSSVVNR